MKNKKKPYSESEKLQDELEPIWWLSTEHDESDDIEDAKKTVEKHKNKKEDHPPRFDGEEEKFVQDFLEDKELADNLQKISNHKKK